MRIIPAIDIKDGKCVRLLKGDFDQTTEYSTNPRTIGERFSELAVGDLHIVDLDGARFGNQQNHTIVADIARNSGLSVQVGGGIRDRDAVARWIDSGVSRCVVGSVAITNTATVRQWLEEFGGDQIVLALDIKLNERDTPMLTTHGWTEESGISLWDCLEDYGNAGARHVLCTDVARDGAMAGPNFDLYEEFLKRFPTLQLQASGGVRHVDDLRSLRELGVPAAITGRALLDGKISALEVSSFQQGA